MVTNSTLHIMLLTETRRTERFGSHLNRKSDGKGGSFRTIIVVFVITPVPVAVFIVIIDPPLGNTDIFILFLIYFILLVYFFDGLFTPTPTTTKMMMTVPHLISTPPIPLLQDYSRISTYRILCLRLHLHLLWGRNSAFSGTGSGTSIPPPPPALTTKLPSGPGTDPIPLNFVPSCVRHGKGRGPDVCDDGIGVDKEFDTGRYRSLPSYPDPSMTNAPLPNTDLCRSEERRVV